MSYSRNNLSTKTTKYFGTLSKKQCAAGYPTCALANHPITSRNCPRAPVQQYNPNPSLFISLPILERGKSWTEKNIREVIDNHDFGEIVQVILYKNKKNAIVHFERWFRSAEDHAVNIARGGSIRIPALYGKHFSLVLYRPREFDARNSVSSDHSNSTMDETVSVKTGSSSDREDDGAQLADIYAFIDAQNANLEDGELFE